jgi:hypothetical protein
MTWKPGDPLPGARRPYERGPLLEVEKDGAICLDSSCWHRAVTPLVQLEHEVYRWKPGDVVARFGPDTPSNDPVTRPDQPRGAPSSDRTSPAQEVR